MSKLDFLSAGSTDIESFMEKHSAYKDLKRSELSGIPAGEMTSAVTAWIESKFADDWSDMCSVINGLPTPCLNVYCADYTAREITDGGFAQAFFNTSRDFIGAAANGLRAIGCGAPADVIEEALKINFDSGRKPADHSIEAFLDFASGGEYNEADEKFRAAFDKAEFDRLVRDYVLKYEKYFAEAE